MISVTQPLWDVVQLPYRISDDPWHLVKSVYLLATFQFGEQKKIKSPLDFYD
jgi:hypothetical protein